MIQSNILKKKTTTNETTRAFLSSQKKLNCEGFSNIKKLRKSATYQLESSQGDVSKFATTTFKNP